MIAFVASPLLGITGVVRILTTLSATKATSVPMVLSEL